MGIVQDLEATRDETLACFALTEAALDLTYGPGKWSVRFLLHHLADTETVEFERIRRILSEPRQVLPAFDQDSWAQSLDYDRLPLGLSRAVFQSVRNAVIHYAGTFYESKGDLEYVHSQLGPMTLRDEFHKVASHNVRHLAHIRAALASR